ncbi:MAG: Mrp/NBP35 family ATP-binding protein [Anaerolineales bacterium]|nr:Mrp/NBP35 family ATP-binding protein [Anaerolineales bacterium]MCW5854890.1 Mrp/NBP35 family ATP-binding protein [Anaerolineales bacterium]
MSNISEETILSALSGVQDPAQGRDLISLNALREMRIKGSDVTLRLAQVTPLHPQRAEIEAAVQQALQTAGVGKLAFEYASEVPDDGRQRGGLAAGVKNIIAIASGKGGVGKSTVSVNVAVALAQAGARVGLLDADIYGPNVPTMMGVEHLPKPPDADGRLTPAEAYGVKMMSIGFLVRPEQAMVWRGPMLHNALRQFVNDVDWGELDYLIVDMPPGTGDVQLSLAQTTPISGGFIVTLPQKVSVDDARRGAEMFRQLRVPLMGVIENMSFMLLPDGQRMEVFGSGGGQALAAEFEIPLIGAVPMEAEVRAGSDAGTPIVHSQPDSPAAVALRSIAGEISLRASLAALETQSQTIPLQIVDE